MAVGGPTCDPSSLLSSFAGVTQGLALTPDDAWAVHSVAHVYEMRTEVDKGLSFFQRTEKDWQVKPAALPQVGASK